jgi:hypothetical protein
MPAQRSEFHQPLPILWFEPNLLKLLNKVAIDIVADSDLASLVVSCQTFAAALDHESADVWRERFLAAFDQPFVSKPREFCWAYKERTFVLRHFVGFSKDRDARLDLQLRVLEEMVLGE